MLGGLSHNGITPPIRRKGSVQGPDRSKLDSIVRWADREGTEITDSLPTISKQGKLHYLSSYTDINVGIDSGGTVTLDLNKSDHFSLNLSGDITLALTNVSIGQEFWIYILPNTNTITWFNSVTWDQNQEPDQDQNWLHVRFFCSSVNIYGVYSFIGWVESESKAHVSIGRPTDINGLVAGNGSILSVASLFDLNKIPFYNLSANYEITESICGSWLSFTGLSNKTITITGTQAGFWVIVENRDSNNPLTINHSVDLYTGLPIYAGEIRLLYNNGTRFISYIIKPHNELNYTTNGIYTIPTGYRTFLVTCIGGGGSGAGGKSGSTSHGGTGGGGGCYKEKLFKIEPPFHAPTTTVSITPAAQVSGGSAGSNGTNGNSSTFGTYLTGFGGGGGFSHNNAATGGGGGGGLSAGTIANVTSPVSGGIPGDTAKPNQTGEAGGCSYYDQAVGATEFGGAAGGGINSSAISYLGGNSTYGGAGGGAGGSLISGVAQASANGGTTQMIGNNGGTGGNGGIATGGTGNNGSNGSIGCGGGGGGAGVSTGGAGGAGGAGAVRIRPYV